MINYDIKAKVIDIKKYNPSSCDTFFIDSNVYNELINQDDNLKILLP
jgi:hypothetical protein